MGKREQYRLEELCLEVTNECLLNCAHCSSNSDPKGGHLDKRVALKVIDDFADMGGKEIEISGGEPLLHPDIFEILEYCKEKSFKTTLYTAGVANLSGSDIAGRLHVDRVVVSLNGTRKITQDITGRDSYNKTRGFVDQLVRAGMEPEVHFVPMKQNYKDFDSLLGECTEMGVKKVKIIRLMPQGRALDNWERIHIPEIEFQKFIGYVRGIYSDVEIGIGTPASLLYCPDGECKAGTSTCLISSDGYVHPCPALKTKGTLRAGNVNERSLKDIWDYGFNNIRVFKEMARPSYCLESWIAPKSNTFEDAIKEFTG